MRVLLASILKLESQAIKWYKDASKCYMLVMAQHLEESLKEHKFSACDCAKACDLKNIDSLSCKAVKMLHEEENELKKHLFCMPENHGGVPLAFLKSDANMHFSLDDDGFEVIEETGTRDQVEN